MYSSSNATQTPAITAARTTVPAACVCIAYAMSPCRSLRCLFKTRGSCPLAVVNLHLIVLLLAERKQTIDSTASPLGNGIIATSTPCIRPMPKYSHSFSCSYASIMISTSLDRLGKTLVFPHGCDLFFVEEGLVRGRKSHR